MSEPFAHTLGPHNAKVVLVGEAWGEQEAEIGGRPFVGHSGRELGRMLHEAGLLRNPLPSRYLTSQDVLNWWSVGPVLTTNVLALRPPGNDMDAMTCKKLDCGSNYTLPPLRQGHYLRPDLIPQLDRLKAELCAYPRNLVIALGNTACWALMHSAKISSLRGTVLWTHFEPKLKVLPTYHPAAVLRNWALRPIAVSDFMKAKREAQFPEVRRQSRHVVFSATLAEIEAWYEANREAQVLACDTETGAGQIKCISFAASPNEAIVIKFVDLGKENGCAWENPLDEYKAWSWIKRILSLPAAKLFQNGLYDLQYLWKMGIAPHNCTEDTMLLHHSIWPELQKGLGFLGSIYCNEPAWKLMRTAETNKRDE